MFFNKKKETNIEKKEQEIIKVAFNPIGLDELISYIKKTCGVDLLPKKSVLQKKLSIFCENKNIESFFDLLRKVQQNKEQMQELINTVTVNETYFYRELPQLEEAIRYIKTFSGKVNVLCAPCASGEEVYSLAFLAQQRGVDVSNLNILGIDINSQAIKDAQIACYTSRSLHRLDERMKNRYFKQKNGKYCVKEEISNINFKVVNIFDNDFYRLGKYDIIFSRNMMIYFDEEFKLETIKRFSELLNPFGRLYTGHADLIPESSYFRKCVNNRLYHYEKI